MLPPSIQYSVREEGEELVMGIVEDTPKPPLIDRPAGPPNPFEAYLLAICAVQGVAVLLGAAKPASIEAASPPFLRIMWAGLLVLGGVFGLAGLYWHDRFTGIEIKRVGLVAAGFGTLAYGVALVAAGPGGIVAAVYNIAFAAACATRFMQVTKRLAVVRSDLSAHRRRRHG